MKRKQMIPGTSAALGGAVLLLGAAVPAEAALIDFTDGGWTLSNPRDIGGVTVTLEAYDTTNSLVGFTETPFDGEAAQCGPLGLTCESDGIGIFDDEVSFGEGKKEDVERLLVRFSRPVDIVSVILLDLFAQGSPTDDPSELAQFQVNGDGGAGGGFTGTATDRTGFFVGTAANADPISDPNAFIGVQQIELFTDTFRLGDPENANSDFALAAINTTSVPEPGILGLIGAGLLGLGFAARRRRA